MSQLYEIKSVLKGKAVILRHTVRQWDTNSQFWEIIKRQIYFIINLLSVFHKWLRHFNWDSKLSEVLAYIKWAKINTMKRSWRYFYSVVLGVKCDYHDHKTCTRYLKCNQILFPYFHIKHCNRHLALNLEVLSMKNYIS